MSTDTTIRLAKKAGHNVLACTLSLSLAFYVPTAAFADEQGHPEDAAQQVTLQDTTAGTDSVTHDQLAKAKAALDSAKADVDAASAEKSVADAALSTAQTNYDTASSAVTTAQNEKAAADAAVTEAEMAVAAAQKKVDDLSGSTDSVAAKAELDNAQAALDAANANKTAADSELTAAQADAATKAAAYESASTKASAAEAEYNTAKATYDDAVSAYNAAKTNYDNGYTDLTELENALEKAEQDKAAASNAYDEADAAYDKAIAACESAETAYNEAMDAYDQAIKQNNADKTNVNKYTSECETNTSKEAKAKTDYETAKAAYDEAKTVKDTAQAAYDVAKTKYDAANSAYNTAKANWNAVKNTTYEKQSHNSDEFFKDMGSNTAYGNIAGTNIDGTQFSGGRATGVLAETDLDSDADATSIDNMVYAIAMIDRYNELRVAAGLSAVGVTDYNMALEQGSVNWSDTNVAHSAGCGNENLAWGYTDPSYGWYYQEKEVFDAEYMRITGSATGCPGAEVYSWYINNYSQCSFASTVGHYINFMNPAWTSMGMAYDTNGSYGNCWGENFSSGTLSTRGTIYTASEYRTRFSNWLISKYVADGMTESDATATVNGMFAKADAYVAFGTAGTNYTLAYNEMKDAKNTLTPLAETFASAETAYNNAKTAYDDASAALATSKANLEAAKTAEAASAADLATKTTAKDNAWSAYTSAQAAEEQAEAASNNASSNYKIADAAFASAQSALDTAKANNATLTSALNTSTANKDAAETAKNTAETNKQTAATALAQAQTDKDNADAAVTTAQNKVTEAAAAVVSAQSTYDTAKAKYDAEVAAASGLSEALAQLDAVKTTLAAKQAIAESAKADLVAKQSVYDQAKSNLETAQACATAANADYSDKAAAKDSAQAVYDALYSQHLAEGHVSETTGAVSATCTADGNSGDSVCNVCGDVLEKGKVIPALGHDWGEWVVTKEATSAATGMKERTCSRCNKKETAEIPMLSPSVQFSDVADAESWCYNYVYRAADLGLMTGYSDGSGKFGPEDSLTRGMVVTLLYRAYNNKTGATTDNDVDAGFSDVERGAWYAAAAKWASGAGITTGYAGSDRFGPNDPVTREQLATFVGRYAAYVKSDSSSVDISEYLGAGDLSAVASKADWAQVDLYAQDGMAWCNANGVVTGYNDGSNRLGPLDGATRAQMAKIIVVTVCDVLGQR